MAFRFTLDGVLRLRESLERAELQKLQRIAGLIVRTRAEIQSVEASSHAARVQTSEAIVARGLTGAELQLETARQAALNAVSVELLAQLAVLEQKRREQQARYVQTRTRREVLSNLYKRQLAEYELEESRRAQRQIDEIFVLRSSLSAASNARPKSRNNTVS